MHIDFWQRYGALAFACLLVGNVSATPAESREIAPGSPGLDFELRKTHFDDFSQGQVGATYALDVENVGSIPNSGLVVVSDELPAGLTATAIAGNGWTCDLPSVSCTREDAPSHYPTITLTVDVAASVPAGTLLNTATVGSDGDTNPANDHAIDPTWILPVAASTTVVEGTPQGTEVGTVFPQLLMLQVRDGAGALMQGATVTFTAPATGASAELDDGMNSGSTIEVVTDAGGHATVLATANEDTGTYTVVASVPGVTPDAAFELTNLAGAPATLTILGGNPQATEVDTPFADALSVAVADQFGNAVPGIPVLFTAPTAGASAVLADGDGGAGTIIEVLTDAAGIASVVATANTITGTYPVNAGVLDGPPDATFALTNNAGAPEYMRVTSGDLQSAAVGSPFTDPLSVFVDDRFGNGVAGLTIHYAAPAAGASAILSDGDTIGTAFDVVTDAAGNASVTAMANAVAGSYTVVISSAGLNDGFFRLTNTLGAPATLTILGGTPQTTAIGTAFPLPLTVQVRDAVGNLLAGVNVAFTAPTSGASAALSADSVSTDANGIASVTATANDEPGDYQVSAGTAGVEPAPFDLFNSVAQVALTVGIDDGRDYARPGDMLDYLVILDNAGPDTAYGVHLAGMLSPALDTAFATWTCLDAGSGNCTAGGSGVLTDNVTVPAGDSVAYVWSAPIRLDALEPVIETAVTASPDPFPPIGATDTTLAVIFRNGFDHPYDGGSDQDEQAAHPPPVAGRIAPSENVANGP